MGSPPVFWIPSFWIPLLALSLCAGCGRSLEIHFDERADFSRTTTWSWLPSAARTIDAPTPYAIGLDRELARLVEDALAARGFARVDAGGHLRVGALLNVRREEVRSVETGAVEQLSSLTSDGAYEIQRSVVRRETYERSRLVVFAMHQRTGDILWRGALEERFEGQFASHLGDMVASLLSNFPVAGSARRDRPHAPETEFTATPPEAAPDA